jgi:hypothetical protein
VLGNLQGWIIAGVLLLAEAGIVLYALSLDATSPPTAVATAQGAMDVIALPLEPRTIVVTDEPGDAGALCRKAAAAYLAEASLYESFIRDRDPAQIEKLTAVEMLVAATRLQEGVIFASDADAVVVYGESDAVRALGSVGLAATTAGLLVEKHDGPRAKKLYEAAFSLGARLFNERLTFREMTAGIELLSTAGACLAEQARKSGQADEAARIVRFTDAQRGYLRDVLVPKFDAIHTANEARLAEHNGDVFAFARGSRERMWRVEAILKLGRMKFNVGNPGSPGDQRHAARLVTRYAEADPDPVVRRAATLARDLTVEQFRTLR